MRVIWDEGKYDVPNWLRIEYYKPLVENPIDVAVGRPGKRVCYVDPEGYPIEVFPSITVAAERMGVSQPAISRSIKEGFECKGLKWEYL